MCYVLMLKLHNIYRRHPFHLICCIYTIEEKEICSFTVEFSYISQNNIPLFLAPKFMVIGTFIAADAQMLHVAALQLISYYCLQRIKHDMQIYLRWNDYKLDEADEQEDKSGTGYVCSETGIHLLRILKRWKRKEKSRETLFLCIHI